MFPFFHFDVHAGYRFSGLKVRNRFETLHSLGPMRFESDAEASSRHFVLIWRLRTCGKDSFAKNGGSFGRVET